MNKKSNYFNGLFLFVLSSLLGCANLHLGFKTLNFTIEAKVEQILTKEGPTFLTDDFRKDFAAFLVAAAKDYEFDPLLILAVMKVESAFKPNAVSNLGALGLLQIKPVAAKEVAKVFATKPVSRYELLDPYINLEVGIQYFSYLRDLFNENGIRMLSAYNMGPTKVRQAGLHSSRYSRKVMATYQKFLSHEQAMVLAKN